MGKARSPELRLREKLARFLKKTGKVGQATEVLRSWDDRGWHPILFGGVIRDLVVLGTRHYPRDVDVVLQHVQTEEIRRELHGNELHINRFGGLHLNINNWAFDVWPLEATWAFKTDVSLTASPANLTKTTFLNIEAVAVTLSGGRIDKIFSNGFFEALESRVIDINYFRNPYPALSAIRSVVIASKLHFKMSAEIGRYFISTVEDHGLTAMVDAQKQHYGKVFFGPSAISALELHFRQALDFHDRSPIRLPTFIEPQQLSFWPD